MNLHPNLDRFFDRHPVVFCVIYLAAKICMSGAAVVGVMALVGRLK